MKCPVYNDIILPGYTWILAPLVSGFDLAHLWEQYFEMCLQIRAMPTNWCCGGKVQERQIKEKTLFTRFIGPISVLKLWIWYIPNFWQQARLQRLIYTFVKEIWPFSRKLYFFAIISVIPTLLATPVPMILLAACHGASSSCDQPLGALRAERVKVHLHW